MQASWTVWVWSRLRSQMPNVCTVSADVTKLHMMISVLINEKIRHRKRLGKNKNRKRLDKKDDLLIRMYFPESIYNLTRRL